MAPGYFAQFDHFDWSVICPNTNGEAYYNGNCTEFVCVHMIDVIPVHSGWSGTAYDEEIGWAHCAPRTSCGATITPSRFNSDCRQFDGQWASGTLQECTTCNRYVLEPYDGRIETQCIDGVTKTVCPDIDLAPLPNCLLALPDGTPYCEADYDDCCADPSVDNCQDND